MGRDGDPPHRVLDAHVHEVDPGTVTTIHRHSWDAILFMVSGEGWTEVDGSATTGSPGTPSTFRRGAGIATAMTEEDRTFHELLVGADARTRSAWR
jgi:quercetin dioxygenase-like cupin family protein